MYCGELFTYDDFYSKVIQLRSDVCGAIFDAASLAYILHQNMETAFPGVRAEADFRLAIEDIKNFTVSDNVFDLLSLQVAYWQENKGSVFKMKNETRI